MSFIFIIFYLSYVNDQATITAAGYALHAFDNTNTGDS
tara:strand:+ start:582 stop:695 length:114 start_codon:yes stop_codon:yes gene_type:complete